MHWLLQIHGGCDVRGGYTDVKCFRVRDEYPETYLRTLAGTLPACTLYPTGAHFEWCWSEPGFTENDNINFWSSEVAPINLPENPLTLPAIWGGDEVPEKDFWLEVSKDKKTLKMKSRIDGFSEDGMKLEVLGND